MEDFDGDEDLVAGLCVVEEDDGLEIVAERDAAAVEIDNLGHRAVGVGVELEPDAGPGEVVAVERLGDLDGAAKPDCVLRRVAFDGKNRPGAVVEAYGFAVGDVAGVKAPAVDGQVVEFGEAVDGGSRGRGQRFGQRSDLIGRLRRA